MDKNIKICIIGGGPAGLSAGMYLEQKGYENYTILEKNDRVGGKRSSASSLRPSTRDMTSTATAELRKAATRDSPQPVPRESRSAV